MEQPSRTLRGLSWLMASCKFRDGGDHACLCLCSLLPPHYKLALWKTERWIRWKSKDVIPFFKEPVLQETIQKQTQLQKHRTEKLQDQFGIHDHSDEPGSAIALASRSLPCWVVQTKRLSALVRQTFEELENKQLLSLLEGFAVCSGGLCTVCFAFVSTSVSLLLHLSYCPAGLYAGDTLTSSDPTPSLSAKPKASQG